MNIFKYKLNPEDVFMPRSEYNPDMYVERPTYEESMKIALNSNMCILIHGQSGTGKTWLTRRVLESSDIYYKVVNLALASNTGSIYSCLKNLMLRDRWEIRTGYSETKAASVNIPIASGGLEVTKDYEQSVDYFMEYLKYMTHRAKNKNRKRYIVFENMETIIENSDLMKELTNLITLVDDEEVVKHKTRFIIIGATKTIHRFFSKSMNINTIDNRLYEVPELGTLTTPQAKHLIKRGFDKLEIPFISDEQRNNFLEDIINVTAGIPQRIHELCLIFSSICRKYDKNVQGDWIDESKKVWINTSLNKNYSYLSRIIKNNKRDLEKNAILYCIAHQDILYFSSDDIDNELKEEFPQSIGVLKLKSEKFLNELCTIKPPLLEKVSEDYNEYYFTDFKCALCLRAILHKEDDKIIKYDIYEL